MTQNKHKALFSLQSLNKNSGNVVASRGEKVNSNNNNIDDSNKTNDNNKMMIAIIVVIVIFFKIGRKHRGNLEDY